MDTCINKNCINNENANNYTDLNESIVQRITIVADNSYLYLVT